MILVNDTLYSCDAVSQFVERTPRYSEKRERKSFNAIATVGDNSCNISQDKSNKVPSKVEVCPMCGENHDIEDCTYYLQQTITIEERNKFLFKNKLCLVCLKTVTKKYNAKPRSSMRSCKVCIINIWQTSMAISERKLEQTVTKIWLIMEKIKEKINHYI